MAVSVVSLFILVASAMFVLATFDGAKAQQAQSVVATYKTYNPDSMNWDMTGMFCATWDANKPLKWRQHYGWTAFCGPDGELGELSCGLCLKVINKATEASTVARVVDKCDDYGLELDISVFLEIDTDGNGIKHNYLKVDYYFIDCED